MASTLWPVLEPFPDAGSALARARAIMRDLGDGSALWWPELEPISTAEQYAYALRTFDAARLVADRDPVVVFPFLNELERRDAITFARQQPAFCLVADLHLDPGLGDLWPLPEGVTVFLDTTRPFGTPETESHHACTEEELDRMVAVLGPLSLVADWGCDWRGLSDTKNCGLRLCLNGAQMDQHSEVSPGEFGVWVELGNRVAWEPEGEAWRRESGLVLGEPRQG
ncbi:hypothetical protein PV682_11405 [Streptomyces niveiscabiei]|uniref:hypothetical protein n=1 Tax=Streptomyces niveiscabiei TaxID=164115 RepID=UPI0029B2216D|nr:hypothetical protein [Streptomyces niveiscabiei]MDX3382058.1 hypothetical protein [Streptomyces niveiscabiei]